MNFLSSIAISLEVEPELKDVVLELTAETAFVAEFPLAVDDLECDIFVGRPGMKSQDGKVTVIAARRKKVLRSDRLFD